MSFAARFFAILLCCCSHAASRADTTVFFDACQAAALVASEVTSDSIHSSGYRFTYTRDKLFTGGTGQPIGRLVRVEWPAGVEAQAVTTPPAGVTDYKARIILQRVDGAAFDLPVFTAQLLGNTYGAGGAIEIMPLVNGEDAFNDPLYFDVTGFYGQTFSYDTSPNPWGSTALLTGYDTYKIALYVDFALVALTLDSAMASDQACCLPDYSCADLSADGCIGQGGTPQGLATTCVCTSCAAAAGVPTVSQWGLLVMSLLMFAAGSALLRDRSSKPSQWQKASMENWRAPISTLPADPDGAHEEDSTVKERSLRVSVTVIAALLTMLAVPTAAMATTAYGTLNNFDCVNDVVVNGTPVECHGFEIELEDIHSTDISYTYDYNHYGIPRITEDTFLDANGVSHPRVFIRWAAKKNPDGSWTAFTAVPTAPISPTDGHQFTNPSVNFGGEHFGVGYNSAPTAVRSFWLYDDGAGNLTRGPLVNIGMPTFYYYPAVAQVQPVIEPPPPPVPPVVFRFGDGSWVKDIKTTSHNPNKVELNDLVDPDPDNPDAHNWTNGEPAEVETEWRLLQTEFAQPDNPEPDNANGELAGLPEELPDGDEIITRRYEFFKYTGPIDAESGEAMASEVAPDGIHGVGIVTYNDHFDPGTGEWVEVTMDLSTVEVVGEFFGAQMSAFDVAPVLGLIDHIPDGEIGVPYADRTVVVAGGAAFLASVSGSLPDGTAFDGLTGVFSGTPTAAGVFTFSIEASDTAGGVVTKTYTVTIPDALPVTSTITTIASPFEGGSTTGDGVYENGTPVIVLAANNPGYAFVNWTENGMEVSALPNYPFTVSADRTLVASFVPTYTVATSASPSTGGTTSGDGVFNSGTSVMVVATPNPGYDFVNWTENGGEVSTSAVYTFTISASRTLVADFTLVGCVDDADCSDTDACTADRCVANVCEHQPVAGCCNTNADCEDDDVCTRDACSEHDCMFEDIPTCCNSDAQCADVNDCTLDTCESFECRHAVVTGCCLTDAECEDTDVCTTDRCIALACDHLPIIECCHTSAECDDADPCTADTCLETVCGHEPLPGCCTADDQCDDGNACTTDTCNDLTDRCEHAGLDSDGDGVCDGDDACPHSLTGATVVIGKCNSGVPNQMVSGGCTMSDQIASCGQGPGDLARCVAALCNGWRQAGIISGSQHGSIQSCVGRGTIRADRLRR